MLAWHGPLDAAHAGKLWNRALREAQAARGAPLTIDLANAGVCDTSGALLLMEMLARHGNATLGHPASELIALLAQIAALPPSGDARPGAVSLRQGAAQAVTVAADAVAFVGEAAFALVTAPSRRRQIRLGDLARLIDEAGFRAIPLVLLLGYLMGLILAFQSSVPLRRFGADLFVVNLVALSLLRELGPLLAAVILAGRTGSAFAAELGTMKVNEELAALETMGIQPMTALVLPRLAAAVGVMPILTVLLELAGLIGMLTVMMAFGFSPFAVSAQLLRSVHLHDFWSGLFKALCFGAAVAAIGCRAGLGAGVGPRAVGLSATGAVVGGIVATIVLDGVFAIVFYRVGV